MVDSSEVAALKAEITRLKIIVTELAAALKVISERDKSAQEFIARVEQLLDNE